jgi:ABC-2 type transport system permease protein
MFDQPLFHMVRKEFRQISRDPRVLRIAIMMPVIQLLIFGYIASTDIRNVRTALIDRDMTQASREYVRVLENTGKFVIKDQIQDEEQMTVLMDSRQVSLGLQIPKGFEKDIDSGRQAQVQAVIDGSNSANATIILGYLGQANQDSSNKITLARLAKIGIHNGITLFDVQTRVWYNPDLKSMNFMVPAIFSQLLLMISMTLTAFSVVKEKEKGTMEQLIVTPLKPFEMIIGKVIPPILIALMDILVVYLVAVFWFRVPMRGSLLDLFSLGTIFMMTGLGLGILISTVSKNQRQSIMTTNLIMSPMFILSGFVFPIASMPVIIQWTTYLIPLRYFLVIVRGIFLKGNGIVYLWPEVWPLMIIGVSLLSISILRFKKKIE